MGEAEKKRLRVRNCRIFVFVGLFDLKPKTQNGLEENGKAAKGATPNGGRNEGHGAAACRN